MHFLWSPTRYASTRFIDAGGSTLATTNQRNARTPLLRYGTLLMLLRKEVIQPHLPVRLPCYDFVPIADPTFDSSPTKVLGHWLRVLPTFVT